MEKRAYGADASVLFFPLAVVICWLYTRKLAEKELRYVHCARVAGVGWLSGTAAESLRAFGERVFAHFCDKNVVFYNCGKTGHLWLSKDLHTHTGTFPQTPFLMLRYVLWLCTGCTKELYESRLYESSLKALKKLSESL